MESLLHALVPCRVCQGQDLVSQVAMVGHEDAAAMEEQSLVQSPRRGQVAVGQTLAQLLSVGGRRSRAADVVDEGEGRPGVDAADDADRRRVRRVVDVPTGQGVDDRVEAAGAVLDG